MAKRDWFELALNWTQGKTYHTTPDEMKGDFASASRQGPPVRIRRSMIAYAKNRNSVRWKRLQSDYAWLQSVMKEMGMNPEDARYLL